MLQAALFYVGCTTGKLSCLLLGLALFGGVALSLFILTIRIEINGDTLVYSYLFKIRKTLRLSEIREVFAYKKPDNILIPSTAFSFTTKIINVLVPFDRKPKLIQIDSSLFAPEKNRRLNSFFGDRLGIPISYNDALDRIQQIRHT
jgi:hypothetical protein